MLRVQLPPMGDRARIAGLLVAPDVWAQLGSISDGASVGPACFAWTVVVDKWLPPGAIVPVDADGRPILKPTVESRGTE